MSVRTWLAACLLAGTAGLVPVALAEDQPAPAAPERSLVDTIKHPIDWFTWGADLRLRQEYLKNNVDFNSNAHPNDDVRNVVRTRGRLWMNFGPFLGDASQVVPTGLSLYGRLAYERRDYTNYYSPPVVTPDWNEVVIDNLYLDWTRIMGMPVSLRLGRQDIAYGRGWVLLDGTPLDGSRTIFSDAIKATIHLDDVKTDVDLLGIDNPARETTHITPFDHDNGKQTGDYNQRIAGIYVRNQFFKPHEMHMYYLYKDEERVSTNALLPRYRAISTYGLLFQGLVLDRIDYYAEGAYQWGRQAGEDVRAYGLTADVGYTFTNCFLRPRIHGAYEYLSGDDPGTSTYEGWDSVMSRWPRWSELWASRWAWEGSMPGNYTNLQRFTLGGSATLYDAGLGAGILGHMTPNKENPYPKVNLYFDYNYLLGNEHQIVGVNPGAIAEYSDGGIRGHLLTSRLTCDINKYVSGHLWAEYFMPGDFYNGIADDAMFLRWEVVLKF